MKNLKIIFFVIISVFFSQTVFAMFQDPESIEKLKTINKKFDGLNAKKVAKIMKEEDAMGTYELLSKQDQERFIGCFTAGSESMEIASIISNVIYNKKSILDAAKEAGFESTSSKEWIEKLQKQKVVNKKKEKKKEKKLNVDAAKETGFESTSSKEGIEKPQKKKVVNHNFLY